jgi:DNA-directed RNA polymerase specialized sigma24 family protein
MCRILTKIAAIVRGERARSGSPVALFGLDLPMVGGREIEAETHADIAERLALMPLFVRETYLLRAVDGMSIDAISARLGISARSARRYLRQAIILLAAPRPR